MNVQVNASHNIEGGSQLNSYVENHLKEVFQRYSGAITRIEVHLSDENGPKGGVNDKKCLLEARISHHQPIVVSDYADTIHEAIEGASGKLLRSMVTMVGKLTDRTSPKSFIEESPAPDQYQGDDMTL